MNRDRYDAVVIGAGHNGLVAACYLAKAGLSVLMLERNARVGGASVSERVFPEFDARLSRYAYLVSLFPQRILRELEVDVTLLRRRVASYTPYGDANGLLVSSEDPDATRRGMERLHPDDWRGFQELADKQTAFAEKVWNGMLEPLRGREEWRREFESAGKGGLWQEMVEEPIGRLIERHITSDLLRGVVLTDGKIGANTHAHDPSLLQNRTFLYHIIGNKTGEWLVPQGGMGSLTGQLEARARALGVEIRTGTEVIDISEGHDEVEAVFYHHGKKAHCNARHVLWNACPPHLRAPDASGVDEGTAFKINMLLTKLPRLKDRSVSPEQAFAGTFHIDEGYAEMGVAYRSASAGRLPEKPAGEIYCHTLTDPSILSDELRDAGYHTLTYFGLDLPYALFEGDPEATRAEVVARVIRGIDAYLDEPLESCLARDTEGRPCIEAKSSVDLERELGLPRGNIFHKGLSWFFAEDGATDAGRRPGDCGVETAHPRVWVCGSSAVRGGAVSGIPGRNAAMAVIAAR